MKKWLSVGIGTAKGFSRFQTQVSISEILIFLPLYDDIDDEMYNRWSHFIFEKKIFWIIVQLFSENTKAILGNKDNHPKKKKRIIT